MDLKTTKDQLQARDFTLKEMQDLNNKNRSLTLELNSVRDQLNELVTKQSKLNVHSVETSQGVLEIKAQLLVVEQAFKELQANQKPVEEQ